MICSKCGFNANNAKFCPKCGAMMEAPAAGQPQDAVQNAQQPQMEFGQNLQQPQTEFGQNTQQGMQFGQNVQPQYAQSNMPNNGLKKKKKWPKVAAIVAAVAVILGVGLFFAWPYVSQMFSPKKEAVAALKNASSSFESAVTNAVSGESMGVSIPAKQQSKGSYKLENLKIGTEDYLSYLKVDTVQYDYQVDTANHEMSGTIGLSKGNAAPVISMKFYTDGSTLYFQIPQMFTESFKVSIDSYLNTDLGELGEVSGLEDLGDIDDYWDFYETLSSLSSNMNAETLSQYSGVIEALAKNFVQGFNVTVDNCEYKKLENTTLESDDLSVKVTAYKVVLTEEALKKGMLETIDAIYSDSTLSVYASMLTSFSGYSKEKVKSSIEDSLDGMQDISFVLYVKDQKIAGMKFDLSTIDSSEDGTISLLFLGEKAFDYMVCEIADDDISVKLKYDGRNTNKKMSMDIVPDQRVYKGEYLNLYIDVESDGKMTTIHSCGVKGQLDDAEVDVKCSAQGTVSEFSKMDLAVSNFRNPIDIDKITEKQQEDIALELANNMAVFKQILSDALYNSLFSQSGLKTY